MTTTLPLGPIHTLAADMIEHVGWTQNKEIAADGSACLTGALKLCEPQPGDWLLARGVYRQHGHGEGWNDETGRTANEVINYLRKTEITNADLAATYGNQWEQFVALIRRITTLTNKEKQKFVTYQNTNVVNPKFEISTALTWAVVPQAKREAIWDETRDVMFDVFGDEGQLARSSNNSTWYLTRATVRALMLRDIIGQYGFTQEHYDVLTYPWAHIIGPVHPDDAPMIKENT